MADPIIDPHVVDFGNDILRPLCDTLPGDYAGCKAIIDYLDNTPGILSVLQAADPASFISDRSWA